MAHVSAQKGIDLDLVFDIHSLCKQIQDRWAKIIGFVNNEAAEPITEIVTSPGGAEVWNNFLKPTVRSGEPITEIIHRLKESRSPRSFIASEELSLEQPFVAYSLLSNARAT